MKYIVMECHPAYAILMDEASNIRKAANLHYEVGQTVSDPILMEEAEETSAPKISVIVRRTAAIAACLAVVAAGGYQYYAKNLKAESVVTILTEAEFRMGLNQKGEVVYLKSTNDSAAEILENYSAKGKDNRTVANELLEIEKQKGYLSDGDSVEVSIEAESKKSYDSLKNELETGIAQLHLTPNVRTEDVPQPPIAPPVKPDPKNDAGDPPVPPAEPVKPIHEGEDTPTLPTVDEKPQPDHQQPPTPKDGETPPPTPPAKTDGNTPPEAPDGKTPPKVGEGDEVVPPVPPVPEQPPVKPEEPAEKPEPLPHPPLHEILPTEDEINIAPPIAPEIDEPTPILNDITETETQIP